MDTLFTCPCGHGATTHAGNGCGAPGCRCERSRERIVQDEIEISKAEVQAAYRAGRLP